MVQMNFIAKIFGDNVLRLRKKSGVSQGALAVRSEVSRSTISKIEKGNGNPSMLQLGNISKALDATVLYMLSDHNLEDEIAAMPVLATGLCAVTKEEMMAAPIRTYERLPVIKESEYQVPEGVIRRMKKKIDRLLGIEEVPLPTAKGHHHKNGDLHVLKDNEVCDR